MAHHEPISKSRWIVAQKTEASYWRGAEVLQREIARIEQRFAPILSRVAEKLDETSNILDVGCGPTCPAQFIEQGKKTYVDPLLDEFRRTYPAGLPKGKFITCLAEDIHLPDASFDLILSIHALDKMHNPELALNEIERLLKPSGVFVLGISLYSAMVARFHYYIEKYLPGVRDDAKPYFYCPHGIRNTLERHFTISEVVMLPVNRSLTSFVQGQDHVFICTRKNHNSQKLE